MGIFETVFLKSVINNNLMMFKWEFFDDFHSMLLQDLKKSRTF